MKRLIATIAVAMGIAAGAMAETVNLSVVGRDTVISNGWIVTGTLDDTTKKISIADGATVTLRDVKINEGGGYTYWSWAGLNCEGDATIILEGTNIVSGFSQCSGIHVPTNKTLTIRGEGFLTASGYRDDSAGIGAGRSKACGNIVIESGNITAIGGENGAGIGGAYSSDASCGIITIRGGTITANGGKFGAGIGGGAYGSCAGIVIEGGTITATGGRNAAGIGSGQTSHDGNITITGGTITATGSSYGAGIGSGYSSSCGEIDISSGVDNIAATPGESGSPDAIGAGGNSGTCASVTIDGVVGAIAGPAPYAYVGGGSTWGTETEEIDGYTWTFKTNRIEAVITGVTPKSGDMVMPSTLAGKTVTGIVDSLFYYTGTGLTSVKLPDGLKSIGAQTFRYCYSITNELVIPASVTSIGNHAFRDCKKLTGNLTIPSGVRNIGDGAFYECYSLDGVLTLPVSVTNIGHYAFYDCKKLTGELTFGSGLKSIGNCAFYNCYKLSGSLTIPYGVTSIGDHTFYNCWGLTGALTIPNSVTSIGDHAFYDCNKLSGALTIPGSVEIIKDFAFANCSGLDGTLTIGYGVKDIGQTAFSGCTRLTGELTIPNSVTNIGGNAFSTCRGLTGTLTISDGVTKINSSFSYCSGITNVVMLGSVTSIGDFAFSECTGLAGALTIPASVTDIGSQAFSKCSNLSEVTIPGSVTNIKNYAFSQCGRLASVTIGSGVKQIGSGAFGSCYGLTGVYISDLAAWCGIVFKDYQANPLSAAKNLYLGERGVTYLAIPVGVTGIGNFAFYGCTNITSVTMPDSVTTIGQSAFKECAGLVSVTIGDNVSSIGNEAFRTCTRLAEVTIPDGVTSIGTYMFNGCTALKDATIGSGVTTIPRNMFDSCSTLTNVTIGVNVTSIDTEAFARCGALKNVTLPKGLESIGGNAFAQCGAIEWVAFPKSLTTITGGAFQYCNNFATAYVPYGCTERIRTLLNDSGFTRAITFVEEAWNGDLAELVRDVTIEDDMTIYGTLVGNYKVSVADGATVTLSNAVINGVNDEACKWAGISCEGDVTLILAEGSANVVRGFYDDYPGIHIVTNKTLTIQGPGSLDASSNGYGAGIGGGNKITCGNIVIEGGTITAAGGDGSAGIGGGGGVGGEGDYNHACGNITITGGEVTATGGECAADIGTGTWYASVCGDVTITKDVTFVTATTGLIGTGRDAWSCGTVTIGGVVGEIDYGGQPYTYYGGDIAWGEATETTSGYTWTFITNHSEAVITGVTPNPTGDLTTPSKLGYKTVSGIGERVFSDCYGLTSVKISYGLKDIGTNAFSRCHGLTNVTFATTVANIENSAFWDCKALSGRLTIPDSVTNIGASAFRYCNELTGLTIGSGVEVIGPQAFDCCGKLTSVTIPDGVKEIGGEAFGHCEGLTSFVVSGAVTNIGDRALVQCTSLRAVYFLGDAPAVGGNIYELTSDSLTTYVPDGSTGWQSPESSVLPAKWPAGDHGRNIAVGEPVFVTVMFDANGGALVGGPSSVTRVAGADEIGALPGAAWEGHWFKAWWTEREGGERITENMVVTAGMTRVYAHWSAGCPFTMGGDAAWTQEPDGSWRSGAIDDYQETWIATNITGRGTLSFKWKVSSEVNCDTLSFVVGTVTNGVIHGVNDWAAVEYDVSDEGAHTFKWVYSKDRKWTGGSDCGWVDEVTWTPYVEDGFASWAAENGLSGADAAWNATPAKWGGKWENAFIYTYGDGLTNSVPLMTISFNAGGKPVITTLPEVGTGFTPAVIGTSEVDNWTSPVVLERDGDNWTLPAGKSANFFRVRVTQE